MFTRILAMWLYEEDSLRGSGSEGKGTCTQTIAPTLAEMKEDARRNEVQRGCVLPKNVLEKD